MRTLKDKYIEAFKSQADKKIKDINGKRALVEYVTYQTSLKGKSMQLLIVDGGQYYIAFYLDDKCYLHNKISENEFFTLFHQISGSALNTLMPGKEVYIHERAI
jgi:hypothetical protein